MYFRSAWRSTLKPINVVSTIRLFRFTILRVAGLAAFGALVGVAQDQVPVPCKYFPTQGTIQVDGAGGTAKIDVRADPLQFQQGKHVEYAKRCALTAYSPAPWLAVSDVTQVNADGHAFVTIQIQSAKNLTQERVAILTLGTPATVPRGAPPHYSNTELKVRQLPLPK
jgi:hypothetical protein